MFIGWYKKASITAISDTDLTELVDTVWARSIQIIKMKQENLDWGDWGNGKSELVGRIFVKTPGGDRGGIPVFLSVFFTDHETRYSIDGSYILKQNMILIQLIISNDLSLKEYIGYKNKIERQIYFALSHELGHFGRDQDFSIQQGIKARQFVNKTREKNEGPLNYRRTPTEYDADVTAILSVYNNMNEEERATIETYDDLFRYIGYLFPNSGRAFWGESGKWKQKIIKRLMREGLVLGY